MSQPRFIVPIVLVGAIALRTGIASGQIYPNKPIRVVTSEVGGGSDLVARLIAPGMSAGLAQQVIVENRIGLIAIETVAKAPPDGYTLLFQGSILWLSPFLRSGVSWDPVKDFLPITLVSSSPNITVVHPSLPVKSVRELIILAKARPGEINYGSGGTGGANHLAAELFRVMAAVDIVRISFRGNGPALNALVGGEVQLMFPSATAATPHVKSGRLRALAITSAEPSPLVPDLPTMGASGVPGYELATLTGMFVPAKTPEAIIKRLNQEIVRVLNQADVKQKFFSAGVGTVGNSPEQFAALIKSEMTRLGKVIKDAGIRTD